MEIENVGHRVKTNTSTEGWVIKLIITAVKPWWQRPPACQIPGQRISGLLRSEVIILGFPVTLRRYPAAPSAPRYRMHIEILVTDIPNEPLVP
jgi:hypothetical protein